MSNNASLAGRVLGGDRFELLELFGRGAFAEVYRGRQLNLNRDVAVKILNQIAAQDEALVKRFHNEAEAVARFDHPNIVKIFDHGEEDGIHFYVMNLLPRTLRSILHPNRPLPLEIILQIARHLAGALAYAQDTVKNFVHRDIKPENIMLDQSHNAILSDFGLVRGDQLSRLTLGNAVIGTPNYMSPEQIRGLELDSRSDLYALGVVLYECATGTPPFKGEIMAVCHQHVNDSPPAPRLLNPGLPEAFEALILKLLAKDPGKRCQSARDLLTALDELPSDLRRQKTSFYSQATIPFEVKEEERWLKEGERTIGREGDWESGREGEKLRGRLGEREIGREGDREGQALPNPPIADHKTKRSQRKIMRAVYSLVAVIAIAAITVAVLRFNRTGSQTFVGENTASLVPVQPMPELQLGALRIGTDPPGATAFIDGVKRSENTPVAFDSLVPGAHHVRLALANYNTWEDSIDIRPQHTAEIHQVLARATTQTSPTPVSASTSGTLRILSKPTCEIFVDRNSRGTPENGSLSLELKPGKHEIEFFLPPYKPLRQSVNVEAGAERVLEFEWFGEMSVQAFDENNNPVFGSVILDSTQTDHLSDGSSWKIVAGAHRISVRKFGYEMAEKAPAVEVRGGKSQSVTIRMKKRNR